MTFYSQALFLLASNNPLDHSWHSWHSTHKFYFCLLLIIHLIFFIIWFFVHSHLYFDMRFWYFKSIPIKEFLKIMYLSWVFGFFFQCITVHRLRAQAAKLCTLPVGSWDIVSIAIKYKGYAQKIKNQRTYWIIAYGLIKTLKAKHRKPKKAESRKRSFADRCHSVTKVVADHRSEFSG